MRRPERRLTGRRRPSLTIDRLEERQLLTASSLERVLASHPAALAPAERAHAYHAAQATFGHQLAEARHAQHAAAKEAQAIAKFGASKAKINAKVASFQNLTPVQTKQVQATGYVLVGNALSYTPAQLRTAYGADQIPNQGQGTTVAITLFDDDPNIASDVNAYSDAFGLPRLDGLNGHGTFTKVQPMGATSGSVSTAVETSLDVEIIHAIAPYANIVLVEVPNSFNNLVGPSSTSAINTAKNTPGVVVISNSYGAGYNNGTYGEFTGENTYDATFNPAFGHPVEINFSTGDNGAYGGYPSYAPNVMAIGGTTLNIASLRGRYGIENGWSGSGGGTSTVEQTPSYQSSNGINFGGRSIPDVSLNADPNTGVVLYDSYGYRGFIYGIGGTSLSSPLWGGLMALVQGTRIANGQAALSTTDIQNRLYSAYSAGTIYGSSFHDVTAGTNNPLNAGTGYDQVTGIGSPIAPGLVALLSN